jgi:hypothetical protein
MADVTVVIGGVTYGLYGSLTASPVTSGEFTPDMTGPTTGQWTCSASSEHTEGSNTGNAWRALTPGNDPTWMDRWCSAAQATVSAPQIWTLQSSVPFQLSAFYMLCRPDVNTLQPTSFQLVGDGVVLYDTGSTPLSWVAGEEKVFAVTTTTISRLDVRCTASGALCSFKAKLFA